MRSSRPSPLSVVNGASCSDHNDAHHERGRVKHEPGIGSLIAEEAPRSALLEPEQTCIFTRPANTYEPSSDTSGLDASIFETTHINLGVKIQEHIVRTRSKSGWVNMANYIVIPCNYKY